MPLDPVVVYLVNFTLAAIFLAGALDKLSARELFASVVEAYGLLPVPFVAVFAFSVGIAELIVGCLLVLPGAWPLAQMLGLALLVTVTMAVVINLLRGRTELSCGCGGAGADQALSWALVWRNGGLAGLLVVGSAAASARELAVLDYGTIAFAVLVGFGLYACANQLLANAPRLARLSSD